MISAFAIVLVKNPNSEPILALSAALISLFCIISETNTKINGTIIIPKGGNTCV